MWQAFRSDLQEFVSTVADDTTGVLSAIDSRMDKEDEEEIAPPRTPDEPESLKSLANDEALRRMNLAETFLEPLEESDFPIDNIDTKTEEIAKLLEDHPDTLKAHFETLVPTEITYKDFWERYYARCNAEAIAAEWQLKEEAAAKARAEAISEGITSVKNFFGGAVKAVSKSLEGTDEAMEVSPYLQASKGEGGINLFGTTGRPPFVMNTAVSEDDLEGDEEEEEEEELGWDDDDEEEDDEDDGQEDEESEARSEHIEFKHEEVEKLQSELAQALEERDQLHATVEMQNKEIASLQTNDTKQLQLQLFEKEAELAALKASLDDTHEDDHGPKKDAAKLAAQQREIERLTKELEEAQQGQASSEQNDWEGLKANLEAKVENLEAKVAELTKELEEARLSGDDTAKSAQEETAQAKKQVDDLTNENNRLQADLEAANQKVAQLEALQADKEREFAARLEEERQKAKETLEAKEREFAAKLEHQSPSSSKSSEVKVTPPVSTAEPAPPAVKESGDDEEDDWGDDWGDDDDLDVSASAP